MNQSAKEKASELVFRFLPQVDTTFKSIAIIQAKQCALIAVEEIIGQLAEINNQEPCNVSEYAVFWIDVRTEINAM